MYGDLSEILSLKRYKEILREIKTQKPEIKEILCLKRFILLWEKGLIQNILNCDFIYYSHTTIIYKEFTQK